MFNLFSQKQPNQQQGNQQQQMPNNNGTENNAPNNNGQQGQQGNPNANSNTPVNPLDVYSKMFDNQATEGDKPPAFTLDPKVMDQVVGAQDFLAGADQELVQKATSGDVNAMMQLMNHVGRSAYRNAIEHGGTLTGKYVDSYQNYSSKKLPDVLRGQLTEQSLAANTPNFKHPVVRKQLTEVAQRLQKLHPDATPQEIADQAKKFITDMAGALKGDDGNNGGQNSASQETNWDDFFGS